MPRRGERSTGAAGPEAVVLLEQAACERDDDGSGVIADGQVACVSVDPEIPVDPELAAAVVAGAVVPTSLPEDLPLPARSLDIAQLLALRAAACVGADYSNLALIDADSPTQLRLFHRPFLDPAMTARYLDIPLAAPYPIAAAIRDQRIDRPQRTSGLPRPVPRDLGGHASGRHPGHLLAPLVPIGRIPNRGAGIRLVDATSVRSQARPSAPSSRRSRYRDHRTSRGLRRRTSTHREPPRSVS